MNIKSKLLAHKTLIGLMSLALVLTTAVSVFAFSNRSEKAPKVVNEAGGTVIFNEAQEVLPPVEELQDLGAVSSPYLPGPDFAVGEDLQFSLAGDFQDATSTIVSRYSPFLRATTTASDVVVEYSVAGTLGYTISTTTVELVRLAANVAATTTLEIDCSSSDTAFTTTSSAIVNTESRIATSSRFYIENSMTSSTNAGFGSSVVDGSGNEVTKILLTPLKPYLVCKAWQPYGDTLSSLTSSDNSFTGKYVIRVSRPQF